ncbi:hypothetical protein FACS1894109_07010 [Spirochaetia bacterium]|nr:hypothetical protein FACS1894109_07010 [Spirochaetia bacterium]
MKEIDFNNQAWGQIAERQYVRFRQALLDGVHLLNPYIQDELGSLSGKSIIHLQCNVGADTIVLAKMGKHAVGVDLVPDNIFYAKKLSGDFRVTNIDFIESDIMKLADKHHEKYDVVFVSEGAVGWLPDLKKWGTAIRHLLKDDGFLYVFDTHPFFLMFDTGKLANGVMDIQFPYFGKAPDVDGSLGYTYEMEKNTKAYFWMYKISDLINSLTSAGLHIEYFNEFRELFFNAGCMSGLDKEMLFNYDFNNDKFPSTFSLKATVYNK